MKKFNKILIFVIILICFMVGPSKADAVNCPDPQAYINTYFNLSSSGLPFTSNGNVKTFSLKKEYLQYIKVYVNNSAGENDPTTAPDENGNISLDLLADKANGLSETTIIFKFTAAPSFNTETEKCEATKEYTFTPEAELADEVDEEEGDLDNSDLPSDFFPVEDLTDTSFIKVTDPTKNNSLSCEYGKNDGQTIKKYTYKGIVSSAGNCKTTCREDVVVTLDPPVITQSGMCFSYVVDIKTKATCSSQYTGTEPTRYKGCIASTYCTGGKDEGGPNDSFDSCIEECDGGDYTQSCINKCYNKVYNKSKNTTTKTSSKSTNKTRAIQNLNSMKDNNVLPQAMAKAESDLKKVKVAKKKNGTWKTVSCYSDSYLASLTSLTDEQIEDIAKRVYESKKYLPGGYYGNAAGYEWTPTKGYFAYNVTGGTYDWKSSGGCQSKINYYYFRTLDETIQTIKMVSGNYLSHGVFNGRYLEYAPSGSKVEGTGLIQNAGPLKMTSYRWERGGEKTARPCGLTCSVLDTCSYIPNTYPGNKKYIVTNVQSVKIFNAEQTAYKSAKKKCESSTNSCLTKNSNYVIKTDETSKNTGNNLGHEYGSTQIINQATTGSNKTSKTGSFPSMIINTNGLCITGECENKNQEYCDSLDKNSSQYVAYCKDKESCKNSGTPACKNGNTCYDYHTTLSFPKNYINVKTGQTKVEITKDKLPFYVAIGNAYCTNLSTKEVNVNWYDYKIDDTNKVAKPKKINKYNITGTIKNYGYSKWNFDFSCFYAIKNPDTGDCVGDNCTPKDCVGNNCNPCTGSKCNGKDDGGNGGNIISKVKVRSVNLSNLFPNRTPRFNWSNEAKNVNNRNYKVDPSTLVKAIEATGDTVYDKDKENKYLDYHIKLTKNAITKIRNYNKGKTYNDSNNGSPVNRINGEGTWGVTVYRSKLLDKLGKKVVTKRGLIGCNNQTSSRSCNQQGGN